jgi:enoyl-CoA hydratase
MLERSSNDGITTLRLAHGKASALDTELLEALSAAFDEERSSSSRAVIIAGSGSIFSAGVDLFRVLREREAYVNVFFPALTSTFRKLFELPKPVVAAVNGHAIAGGCIVAAACDYRLMAEGRGRIGIPELHVGVPFPPFALELMRFATAPQHLQDVIYSGATYSPADALQRGLVDEVCDAAVLEDRAFEKAAQLAQIAPEIFAATKQQLRATVLRNYDPGESGAEAVAQRAWTSPEAFGRIERYLEKTVPKKA